MIFTLFHGRPKVSEAFLRHTTALGPIYAAVTQGDRENIDLCRAYGVHHVEVPNAPLGAKANAAMAIVPKVGRVMVLGSDDFVSREWYDAAMAHDADIVMPAAMGLWEPSSGRACVLTKNPVGAQYFGAGRVYSEKVRKAVGVFWPPSAMSALDSYAMSACHAAGFMAVPLEVLRVPVCDVKTHTNLWPMNRWINKGRHCGALEVTWMMSSEVVNSLTACV